MMASSRITVKGLKRFVSADFCHPRKSCPRQPEPDQSLAAPMPFGDKRLAQRLNLSPSQINNLAPPPLGIIYAIYKGMKRTSTDRMAVSKHYWHCNVCGAQNSVMDGECQYCECQGKDCKRDSCSDPSHFHYDAFDPHTADEPIPGCRYCDQKVF